MLIDDKSHRIFLTALKMIALVIINRARISTIIMMLAVDIINLTINLITSMENLRKVTISNLTVMTRVTRPILNMANSKEERNMDLKIVILALRWVLILCRVKMVKIRNGQRTTVIISQITMVEVGVNMGEAITTMGMVQIMQITDILILVNLMGIVTLTLIKISSTKINIIT